MTEENPTARSRTGSLPSRTSSLGSRTSSFVDAHGYVRHLGERESLFAVAGCMLALVRYTVVAICGGALGGFCALGIGLLRGPDPSLASGPLVGAASAVLLLALVSALKPLPWRRYAAHVAYRTAVLVYRAHALLTCTRPHEPEPGKVLLSVQTNGMGHVVQALRLIELLKARGVRVDTVCFGDLAKVPEAHRAQLRKLLPDALLFDLGHEVDHDSLGMSSLLYSLAATFCLVAAPQGLRVFRRVAALCAERRFSLCIALWEYHVPLYIEATRAPMGLIQVATQGMLYLDEHWPRIDNHFQAQLMCRINLGSRGLLVPLLFSRPSGPQAHGPPGAAVACAPLPVVFTLPPPPPAPPPEGWRVDRILAYSATPACLAGYLLRIKTRKVLLFVKNVEKWRFHFRKCKNIETRGVSDEFVALLPRCAGLVASPSPGVVLQALAAATPCFVLPATPGHLEQHFNHEHLFRQAGSAPSPGARTLRPSAQHGGGRVRPATERPGSYHGSTEASRRPRRRQSRSGRRRRSTADPSCTRRPARCAAGCRASRPPPTRACCRWCGS